MLVDFVCLCLEKKRKMKSSSTVGDFVLSAFSLLLRSKKEDPQNEQEKEQER